MALLTYAYVPHGVQLYCSTWKNRIEYVLVSVLFNLGLTYPRGEYKMQRSLRRRRH